MYYYSRNGIELQSHITVTMLGTFCESTIYMYLLSVLCIL